MEIHLLLYLLLASTVVNLLPRKIPGTNSFNFSDATLTLKYQTIDYDSSQELFNFKVTFEASAHCQILKVDLFSSSQIVDDHLNSPRSSYVSNATKSLNVAVSAENLNINKSDSTTFFRLTAVDENDRLCSDVVSIKLFIVFCEVVSIIGIPV